MFNKSKFLPALALAVSLVPLAAQARGDVTNGPQPAATHYLNAPHATQTSAVQGRASESYPSGFSTISTQPGQYATIGGNTIGG
jgi:hypothetical protein